jgi:hypothetical protein
MNQTTYDAIKRELLSEWDQLTASKYPEDLLNEWADSTVPIYYSEVVKEWMDLTMDETDAWQELGLDADATIFTRMQVDLLLHYQKEYAEAYAEILREKEEAGDE